MDYAALGDNELALALKGGDQQAFDEIVRRHQGRVYAVAYRMMGNREDALDVSQEALLKAYQKIGSWQPTGGFLPWLLRLTSNQSIDHLRKKKRQRHERLDEAFIPDTEGAAVEPTTVQTEEEVRAREIDERVQGALHVLSPTQKTVFILRHYQGLQLSEIADELGCTVGSVKVHLFRSLKKLRGQLEDLYERHDEEAE
jgi:RNA polymerase sigma-70 factor (ECF subfamily)